MKVNTQLMQDGQHNVEPINILDIATPATGLPDEHPDHVKWAIITLWQWEHFPSNEAIYWLQISKHISAEAVIGDPDAFMRMYVVQQHARAEGGKK